MFLVMGQHTNSSMQYLGYINESTFDGEDIEDIISSTEFDMEEVTVFKVTDQFTVEKHVSFTINEV